VLKGIKAIHGTKQGDNRWFKLLRDTMVSLGYVQSEFDECLYFMRSEGDFIIMVIFVDDGICWTNKKKLYDWTLGELNKHSNLR
jgi:hypothetical protein